MMTLPKMQLRPEPWVRLRTGTARDRAKIPAELRQKIRGLIRGELQWPLLLHGSVGTGKTCAALSLCDYSYKAAFMSLEEAADEVVNGDLDRDWIAAQQLFVVDELGERNRQTDLHYTALKRILDAREQAENVAIYISNLKPSDLHEVFDDRIADRLTRGTVFKCLGQSMRRQS